MLDVKNPEIRVDEIMLRIQEKVRARREANGASIPPPSAGLDPAGWHSADQALARAQEVAQVGASLPAMSRIHGFKRVIAGGVARAFLRLAQLITRDQRTFNVAALEVLRTLNDHLRDAAAQLAAVQTEVAALRSDLASTRADLAQAQTRIAGIGRVGEELREEASNTTIKIGQLRTSVSLQERRLEHILQASSNQRPAAADAGQVEALAAESSHLWDATYLHFEDEFRGSREEIKQRVSVYLPKLRAAGAGTETFPILDVGCGRGELVEVLRAEGLAASGVDANRAAVEQCRERGLPVDLRDAFEALGQVADGSLGGLTALHVVEHLPFSLVLKLLDEALRVLRPGGIAIFETPNPKNVLVGSASFYLDPTHRNPVHPQTLHYLMEARGLVRVEAMMLHPWPAEARLPDADSELARRFNEYFYGPQDYAVVGYRP
jgi:2-polyprenyl-3-methyl-5-hydroxy-6-metoxy-1,4-benzoquinol methylase